MSPRHATGLLAGLALACADGPPPDDGADDTAALDPDTLDGPALPDLPTVCVSELMARNDVSLPVDDATPDWLELHNPTDDDVSLAGWTISDADEAAHTTPLSADLVVPAGGVLLLYADDDPAGTGGVHLPFKLSAGGDAVVLTDPGGRVDRIDFDGLPADYALVRASPCCPDPSCWSLTYGGTPGSPPP